MSRRPVQTTSLPSAALVATVLALMSAGCGDGDDAAKVAPTLNVTVTELDSDRARYEAPRSIRAGLVRINLRNKGKEPHKAQLVRVQGNHSIAEARRVRRPFPRWVYTEGGVGFTPPGKTDSVIQRLSPGRYYITGNYGERGRVAPLTVVGEAGEAKIPETSGSIVTNEYSFITSGLKAGTNRIRFANDGLEPHHAVVAPVQRGSSVRALRRFLKGKGTIPVGKVVDLDRAQETSVIERGQEQVTRVRLKPETVASSALCRTARAARPMWSRAWSTRSPCVDGGAAVAISTGSHQMTADRKESVSTLRGRGSSGRPSVDLSTGDLPVRCGQHRFVVRGRFASLSHTNRSLFAEVLKSSKRSASLSPGRR